jgi:hypothetical protein
VIGRYKYSGFISGFIQLKINSVQLQLRIKIKQVTRREIAGEETKDRESHIKMNELEDCEL